MYNDEYSKPLRQTHRYEAIDVSVNIIPLCDRIVKYHDLSYIEITLKYIQSADKTTEHLIPQGI